MHCMPDTVHCDMSCNVIPNNGLRRVCAVKGRRILELPNSLRACVHAALGH